MFIPLATFVRRLAVSMDDGYSGYMGDSPYINIPIYQKQTDPSDSSQDIGIGPPGMYDEPDRSTRTKNVEDIRRQGERPQPSDRLDRDFEHPVTITVGVGLPRENLQGGPWNDTTDTGAQTEDENRDTINFDEGDLTLKDQGGNVVF